VEELRTDDGSVPAFAVAFVSVLAGTFLAAELLKTLNSYAGPLDDELNRAVFQFQNPSAATNRGSTTRVTIAAQLAHRTMRPQRFGSNASNNSRNTLEFFARLNLRSMRMRATRKLILCRPLRFHSGDVFSSTAKTKYLIRIHGVRVCPEAAR